MTNGTKIPNKFKKIIYEGRPEARDIRGNSNFCIAYKNNIRVFIDEPCFAAIRTIGEGSKYIGHYIYPPKWVHEETLLRISVTQYFDWLINRSPFHTAFPEQSLKRAVTEAIIVDCNTPANLLLAALIASRQPHEYATNVAIMQKLVRLGVPENMAFMASYFVDDFIPKINKIWIETAGAYEGHMPCYQYRLNRLPEFLSSLVPADFLTDPYSIGGSTTRSSMLWSGEDNSANTRNRISSIFTDQITPLGTMTRSGWRKVAESLTEYHNEILEEK